MVSSIIEVGNWVTREKFSTSGQIKARIVRYIAGENMDKDPSCETMNKKPIGKAVGKDLGKTLTNLKHVQETLPTSLKRLEDSSSTAKYRLAKLQEYGGGSLAYSSLQSGMKYYMYETLGYIAYVPLRDSPNSVCVLADPIASEANKEALIDEFLKVKSDPIFLHIGHHTAKILDKKGFSVNQLGVETIIDIQKFTLTGNKKQQLRQARNHAQRDNIEVMEIEHVDDEALKAFKKISDDWRKEKVKADAEMQFIVRPLVYVDEIDVRKFVAVMDGKIVGFVTFDPMYENQKVIGYIANHLRSNLERSYSVVDYIIMQALEIFKAEGKKSLSLGLCPMAKVDDNEEFHHSRLLKAHFRYAYERANYLYNFKNLYRHKSKYRPEMPGAYEEKVYCAMKTRFLLVRIYDVYRVLGLNPVKQTVTHLTSAVISGVKQVFFRSKTAKAQKKNGDDASIGEE
jgi:lysylphosphatidylglycerol synthetase-like protein (DUF2156 family)